MHSSKHPHQSLLALWRARRQSLSSATARALASSSSPPHDLLQVGQRLPALKIERLAADGKAVALVPSSDDGNNTNTRDFVVLVDWALPGEVVEARVTAVKKGYAEASRLRTVSPPPTTPTPTTPSRFFLHPPPCPEWAGGMVDPLTRPDGPGGCGGCALQALAYESQLEHKADAVRQALVRVGGLSPDAVAQAERAIVPAPQEWGYRNKASYIVSADVWKEAPTTTAGQQQLKIGMTAPGTRATVVPVASCGLQPPGSNGVLNAVRKLAAEHGLLDHQDDQVGPRLRRLVIRSAAACDDDEGNRSFMAALVTDRGFSRRRLMPVAEALVDDSTLGVVSVVHCEEEAQASNSSRHAPRAPRVVASTALAGAARLVETLVVQPPLLGPESAPPFEPLTLSFEVSADSFFQVNSEQAGRLYGLVVEAALGGGGGKQLADHGAATVLDLFCGAGAIGIAIARRLEALQRGSNNGAASPPLVLVGVDSSSSAIADARRNAARNGVAAEGATFACGDLDRLAAALEAGLVGGGGGGGGVKVAATKTKNNNSNSKRRAGGGKKDAAAAAAAPSLALPLGTRLPRVIVVNPARAGLGLPVIDFLTGPACADAQRIVYVSCNPRTLARDVARLAGGGGGAGGGAGKERGGARRASWRLESFRPVDLMPQTDHVETVAVFVRRD
jgi:23S rRNA (uracil1939-C5)-methyltransferase